MRPVVGVAVLVVALARGMVGERQQDVVDLALPTENDALFRGGGAEFYQVIERDFRGEKSWPWQGGQYGFVRDPMATARGIIYTRFHEGIDVRPRERDQRGDPLDPVRAIADGEVVHVNVVPSHSNYGKYIVIEHRWDGASYYSLYGHLKSANVNVGQSVRRGEQIAVLGYTGKGINQARAHLHLELNLMLSPNFQSWYDTFHKEEPNYHGLYNGINLKGIDIAQFYLALRRKPTLSIPEFLADDETFYKVALPNSANFDFARRYPQLVRPGKKTGPRSWIVSFARSGLPLEIEPGVETVDGPRLVYIKKSAVDYRFLTQNYIAGTGENAHLTREGEQLMQLLIWPR